MSPSADQIRRKRRQHGLTQTDAAKLIGVALRTWQRYEEGMRQMHARKWELFLAQLA